MCLEYYSYHTLIVWQYKSDNTTNGNNYQNTNYSANNHVAPGTRKYHLLLWWCCIIILWPFPTHDDGFFSPSFILRLIWVWTECAKTMNITATCFRIIARWLDVLSLSNLQIFLIYHLTYFKHTQPRFQ